MKLGDVVACMSDMEPLKKGDKGTIKAINYELTYPLTVYFQSIKNSLPMKLSEVRNNK